MTSASPWMPLYVGDYLRDTTRLTAEQHGAYMLLLMDYWTNGSLPDNDATLAIITRLPLKRWRETRAILAPYFSIEGGQWHHKRVDVELERSREFREKQRSNGKLGGRPRKKPEETQTESQTKPNGIAKRKPDESLSQSHSSVTSVTAAEAAAEDPVKAVFDLGVSILTKAGKSEQQARTMVGRWRRDQGDAPTSEALLSAREKTDPVAWIEGRFANAGRNDDALIASIDRKYAGART